MNFRISKQERIVTRSGFAKARFWVLEPDELSRQEPNPLMGWSSSESSLGQLDRQLFFATVEEAISFARRQGWSFSIVPPHVANFVPHRYADKFRIQTPMDEERQLRDLF